MGSRIRDQLEDQSVQFANNKKYVALDTETNKLMLSPILNWYGQDFDERFPEGGYLKWINELTNDPEIKEATEKAMNDEIEIGFFEYDWALNSQAEPGVAKKPKSSGGFGSGFQPRRVSS